MYEMLPISGIIMRSHARGAPTSSPHGNNEGKDNLMSRRWFRLSTSSKPSAESNTDKALTTALAGDLSRRLFSKRLLVAVPVAAAALLTDAPEAAEAAPVADWTLTGNAIPDTTKFLGTTNNQ